MSEVITAWANDGYGLGDNQSSGSPLNNPQNVAGGDGSRSYANWSGATINDRKAETLVAVFDGEFAAIPPDAEILRIQMNLGIGFSDADDMLTDVAYLDDDSDPTSGGVSLPWDQAISYFFTDSGRDEMQWILNGGSLTGAFVNDVCRFACRKDGADAFAQPRAYFARIEIEYEPPAKGGGGLAGCIF